VPGERHGGLVAGVLRSLGPLPGNMPLTKTFFSPSFGMLADRSGVSWMVCVPQ